MKVRAYAKINLGLEVLGRRADGYHEIRTILQTIDLYDRLTFEPADRDVHLDVGSSELPSGEDNLVVQAARRLAQRTGSRGGIRIALEKNVPPGRGLGGGSSDAAMTLVALNRLWDCRLSLGELFGIAAEIGMDVPFFLVGGTALGIGRGEEVFPLECQLDLPIVLILPDFAIRTADAYGSLILTKRETSLKLQSFMLSGLGGSDELLGLVNDLESTTKEYSPAIDGYKNNLAELGASVSLMSGSGSAVYGIFLDEAVARSAAQTLTAKGIRAIATRTLTRPEYLNRRLLARPRRDRES